MDFRKSHTTVSSRSPSTPIRETCNDHTTYNDHTFTRCSKENRYRALHRLRLDES